MTVGHASVPFLDFKSFTAEESEAQEAEVVTTPLLRSPFISVYELAAGERTQLRSGPAAERFHLCRDPCLRQP